MKCISRARAIASASLALAALCVAAWSSILVRPSDASIRAEDRGRIGRPRLVAPAEGERIPENAARFAFEAPAGARATLLLSRRPFDPSSWSEIPELEGLTAREAAQRVLSLAEAGVKLEQDQRLWWAVAVRDPGSGRLAVSEVRSFTALRKFANRMAASPFLLAQRKGSLAASELVGAPRGARAQDDPAQGRRIRLSAGYDFAPLAGEPVVPAELSSERLTPGIGEDGGLRSWLVQFEAAPDAGDLEAITRAGGAVFSYVPDHAYLVRMTEPARAALAAAGSAAWIGEFRPAYKISPLVDRGSLTRELYVALLFNDANVAAAGAAFALLGVEPGQLYDNGINKMIRFRATAAELAAVASHPAVAWVEPVIRLELYNDMAQWVVQTNINGNRRVWDMGIHGEGQVVMTSDSGIETTHEQFRDNLVPIADFGDYPTHRKIIAYKKGSDNAGVTFGDHGGATFHGTHTAGTVAGSDDVNGNMSPRDGMAKEAKLYFMDISGPGYVNGVDPFGDLNDLFLPSYMGNAGGAARISSHSWGGAARGAYTIQSYQVDQFMWAHPDFYVTFANGNSSLAGTVGTPASAKNSAGAGGTQNGPSNGIYSGTSRGPTADGRRKPTYCSPGQALNSATGAPGAYLSLTGTSMASPSGTGAIALMRQYLTAGWYPTGSPVAGNGFAPSAALLKAMGINSALETAVTGFTAPDMNVGWGKLCADNVLYFPGDARKLLLVDETDGLGTGQFIEYQVNVVDGSIPLEVTLCWTDFPGNPAAAAMLVNNLNLTVSKGATTYKGNIYSGEYSTTGGSSDAINVEENVRVALPATGVWTVRVEAPQVPFGLQPFALCVTGGVGNGAGMIALDRAEYGTTSTVEIQVIDTNAGASVDVHMTSTSSGDEYVTLTGANGVYTGTVQLTPYPSDVVGLGNLTVANGGTIVATYQDAAPTATVSAQARIDIDTPVITDVQASSQGPSGTLVTWTTDINASSRVYYGLTPALELGTVTAPGANVSHQVLIANVTPGATYYYDVESVSLSGSLTRDNLGGAHYRFTGKAAGDVLLIFGESPHVRAYGWENALQGKGYDYDKWLGPLAETPQLGGLGSGMRSYRAVLWQSGMELYPPLSDLQRQVITDYLLGGGRFAISGHDVGWALGDPASPFSTPERRAWLETTLKATYVSDPATWTVATGIAGDPISGAYTGGVPYFLYREGGAGDEIQINQASGGTASYTWIDNATPLNVGFRWESLIPDGSAATALWGGQPSRLVNMFFEFTGLAPPINAPSAIRNDVLDKSLVWLFGRPRPTVQITGPNGGQNITGGSVSVSWTETVGPGRAIASRVLEYSLDDGASWIALASGVGPSPYTWNLSGVPNAAEARVRIRVTDDGSPSLRALDASDASFALSRTGADAQGPLVVAGSIMVSPNPIRRTLDAALDAQVTDQNTGGSTVVAAEWSYGDTPAAAGTGTAMTGPYGTVTVDVSATIVSNTVRLLRDSEKLWVRARDAAGNWGPASMLAVTVICPFAPPPPACAMVGVEDEAATMAFLAQNAPNPFGSSTLIRFGLPSRAEVRLGIYDLQGRLVRSLIAGTREAGIHSMAWDRRDVSGARVRSGIYYARLITPAGRLEKCMIALE
jgi:subtilase family protein/flagellar hook capping protein FlgD